MFCYGFLSKGGTGVSYFLLLVTCLLPLDLAAKGTLTTRQQLEAELHKVLSNDVTQWQKQVGIKSLQQKIKIQVPSGADNLEPCDKPLQIDTGSKRVFGNLQRKVSCDTQGWSMFVRAKVKVTARLPVMNRALKRGEFVAAQDIEWKALKLGASDRDLMTRIEDIVGRQVTRKIRRHRAIELNHLSLPLWVNLGDKVIIEARSQGFYANMTGEALDSGGEGQAIRVKNLSSGKIITAYPTGKGRVATRF
ncbi:flagellar basal body P-ring formation protein FlgA [Shewanella sp. VB17]|uniref:flagellar basal body P-ring formation chaperone FlgA n=1 Tax=Shewanella sp. VB17 TaxID=2739432 RepID=UPI0015644F73|nr:flagellar basal body P-ring formation chaperone FlgA [Shewanella sp. VB17]NRD72003.1 flagellar basal body P-ring formation protein FlgA [Shewanella sp. VB17]